MKKYKLMINGEKYEAKVLSYKGNEAKVNVNGIDYLIEIEQENVLSAQPVIQTSTKYINPEKLTSASGKSISGDLIAPIPGVVVSVHKKEGEHVETGDVLVTLEAMKMESELVAPISGRVSTIKIGKGDSVLEGDLLLSISSDEIKKGPKPAREKPKKSEEPRKTVPQERSDGSVRAPIPGTVLDIRIKEGDHVKPDDIVIILEAMKMESEIHAGTEGRVTGIMVSKGASVNEGDVLLKIGE